MRATDHIDVPDGFTDKVRRIAKRVASWHPGMPADQFLAEQKTVDADFQRLFRRWP
jgi:hypothetical protein